MRLIKYAFIFAVVFLFFKAFFLDDYLEERRNAEANASVENVEEKSILPKTAAAPKQADVSGMAAPKKEKVKPNREGMPIDALGDSIAEKLDDKF